MLPVRASQKGCKEEKVVAFLSAWICHADVELAFDLSKQQICIHSVQPIVH